MIPGCGIQIASRKMDGTAAAASVGTEAGDKRLSRHRSCRHRPCAVVMEIHRQTSTYEALLESVTNAWEMNAACLSCYLSLWLSVSLQVSLYVCVSVYLYIFLYIWRSGANCLSISLFLCLPLSLSLSLWLPVSLSFCLFVYLFSCTSVCVCLCVCSPACSFNFQYEAVHNVWLAHQDETHFSTVAHRCSYPCIACHHFISTDLHLILMHTLNLCIDHDGPFVRHDCLLVRFRTM